jgi:hypothetical protein
MRVVSTSILIILCIALLATQAGCLVAAAAAGTGATVAYVRGDTETTLPGHPKEITAASEAAAKDLKLTVTQSTSSGLDGKMVARTASDTPVVVTVKTHGPDASRVTIRVGRFGDDVMQNQLLERIRENLKKQQPATASAAE